MSRVSTHEVRDRPCACARFSQPAADEVVDDVDAKALVEQQIDHVAADEAGAAGDDRDLAQLIRARSFQAERSSRSSR